MLLRAVLTGMVVAAPTARLAAQSPRDLVARAVQAMGGADQLAGRARHAAARFPAKPVGLAMNTHHH